MHSLHHLAFAIVLILACGCVTARFFTYQTGEAFGWGLRIARSRYFWIGVLVALIFLWSDLRFEHAFSLPTS